MIAARRPQARFALVALGFGPISLATFGQAQNSEHASSIECVSLPRVTRTEVVDEHTIRFHLRGQGSYSNYLPQACPGLDARARFTYETASSRLCNGDTITLLEQGSRLTPGITCRLGRFVPAAAERPVDLTAGESGDGGRAPIEIRRVDVEPTDAGAEAKAAEPRPSDRPEPPDDD